MRCRSAGLKCGRVLKWLWLVNAGHMKWFIVKPCMTQPTDVDNKSVGLTKVSAGGCFRVRRKRGKNLSQNYPKCEKTDSFFSHVNEKALPQNVPMKKLSGRRCCVSSILNQNMEWSRGLRVKTLSVTDAAPSHLYGWFIWIFKRDWLEVRGAGLNVGTSLIHWGRNHSKFSVQTPTDARRTLQSAIKNQCLIHGFSHIRLNMRHILGPIS